MTPGASIVVPAHNEERRGFVTLSVLAQAAQAGCLVIVVCNGCDDATAALARQHPRLQVVELATASKSAALNAGDALALDVFPRVYLDADVTVDLSSLEALIGGADSALAVGPRARFLTEGAPWLVRAYYEALDTIPFLVAMRAVHLEGRGAFAVSRTGRARFGAFPPIRADDTYFDRMFAEDEKETVTSAAIGIPVARTVREFLRSQTRSALGSWELGAWLEANQPDRLVVSTLQSHPRDSLARRIRHHLSKGSLVRDWSLHTVAVTAAYLLIEAYARSSATLHRVVGRVPDWR